MQPKISIIIPTFNCDLTLEESLISIINQSYKNIEVIVIDGNSKDNTIPIISKYKDKIAYWISEKDKGIYDAMNKGINAAKGDWIYFLGSDDILFSPTIIEEVFSNSSFLEYDILYGNVMFKQSREIYSGEFDCLKLRKINICHQSIFCKKSVFKELGIFNLKYRALSDWDFNLRWFGNNSIKKKFISKTIAVYNEEGFSKQNIDWPFYEDFDKLIKNYFGFSDWVKIYFHYNLMPKFKNKFNSIKSRISNV